MPTTFIAAISIDFLPGGISTEYWPSLIDAPAEAVEPSDGEKEIVPLARGAPSSVTPPDGLRRAAPHAPHVKYSLFTGSMNAVRHSLKVLWPSATYLRKRRRRLPPPAWIILGALALLFAAFGFAALVYEGFLDF